MTDNIPVYLVVVRFNDNGERNDRLYRVVAYTAADAVCQALLPAATSDEAHYVLDCEPWTEEHEKKMGGTISNHITRDGSLILKGAQLVVGTPPYRGQKYV